MLCALIKCMVYSAHCHSTRGIMVSHLIHELRTGIALQHGVTQWLTLIVIETDNIMQFMNIIAYTKLLINRCLFNTQLFIYLTFWNRDSLTFFPICHFLHSVKELFRRFFSFIRGDVLISLHLQGLTSHCNHAILSRLCVSIL